VGRPRILVTNRVHGEVLAWLAAFGDVDANTALAPWSADEVRSRAAAADAVLAFMPDRIDAAFLAGCPRLKIVACALKGFDNFDVEACTAAGVWLTVVPDLLTAPTAELAIGLAIALARYIRDGDTVIRSGAFEGWRRSSTAAASTARPLRSSEWEQWAAQLRCGWPGSAAAFSVSIRCRPCPPMWRRSIWRARWSAPTMPSWPRR
jgi:lactate dehydrogenase-like 2-hydroxyacid dehydrogenase